MTKTAASPSSRTVVVACKVPNGVWLQLQVERTRPEMTQHGMSQVKYMVFEGKRYYINGPAYPVGTLPKGFPDKPDMVGGYALTFGIPADFWEKWTEQNARAEYLTPESGQEHGAIFAYPALSDTKAAARENEAYRTGLEPLSTEEDAKGNLTDPRIPKPPTSSLQRLATEKRPD